MRNWWQVHEMDLINVFFQRKFEGEVYIQQVGGFKWEHPIGGL